MCLHFKGVTWGKALFGFFVFLGPFFRGGHLNPLGFVFMPRGGEGGNFFSVGIFPL